jgi:cell division protein FtsB
MPDDVERASVLKGTLREGLQTRFQLMAGGLRKVTGRAPRGEYVLWGLILALACLFLWSAFFGPQGALGFLKLRGSLRQLEAENRVLLLQNQALEKEVYLLRNSPAYMEKVAREEFGYAYEGEKVYTFSDADPGAGEKVKEAEIGEKVPTPP